MIKESLELDKDYDLIVGSSRISTSREFFREEINEKFTKLHDVCLEKIDKFDLDYNLFHHVVAQIEEFLQDFNECLLIHDTTKINKVAQNLGFLLFPNDPDLINLVRSLIYLFLGDLDHIDLILLRIFKINFNQLEALKKLTCEFQNFLKPAQDVISNKISHITNKNQPAMKCLDQIINKMSTGDTITNSDLFKAFDIDQSGKIGLKEFRLLTKRLRMNLSEHRIIEIFTTVSKNPDVSSQELDEKEFELALTYLQNKSVIMTLETLGITQELLIIILIWLTMLLLIIFAFIFVGIQGFALGGTFGAIINSLFPIG